MTSNPPDPAVNALNRDVAAAKDFLANRRLEEALEAFTSLVERWPGLDQLYPVLCNLTLMVGHSDPRPEWITRAVAHDASLRNVMHDTVTRLLRKREFARARDIIEALLAGAPDDAGLLRDLGVVQDQLGDIADAEKVDGATLGREASAPVTTTGSDAGSIELHCDTLVSTGPIRKMRVTVRSKRPARPRILSMDVYPSDRPGHPERHHGYWNLDIDVPPGGELTLDVCWDWANRTVTFDGQEPTNVWHGPLEGERLYVLTLVVYENGSPVASEQVKQRIGKTMLESALWFVTYRCNMKCPYCWEVQRLAEGEAESGPSLPADKVAAAWNRLGPGILDLRGGEPFLRPHLIEILDALDDRIRIALETNLSIDVTEFAQRISPEKIHRMTLNLHPTQRMNFEYFLGRALLLKNRGFDLTVDYVAWPSQLWLIPYFKEKVEGVGLPFHVSPCGQALRRPFDYTKEEKDLLRPFLGDNPKGHWFGEVAKAPVLCSGGLEHMNVQPDGEAFRCLGDKLWHKPSLGNIFDEGFSLNEERTTCDDFWRCPPSDKKRVHVEVIESVRSADRASANGSPAAADLERGELHPTRGPGPGGDPVPAQAPARGES